MSDTEFQELCNAYINAMLSNESITKVSELSKTIRLYIYYHQTNQESLAFIRRLLLIYLDKFQDENLLKAYAHPDTLKHYKKMDIWRNLPHMKYPEYFAYITAVLNVPNGAFPHPYESLYELLKLYVPEYAENWSLKTATIFYNSNEILIHAGKDIYKSIEEEIQEREDALNGEEFFELKCFANEKRSTGITPKLRTDFANKKVGNIGEIHAYNEACTAYEDVILVARDVKNGFGYDIIYIDDDGKENLVEVKTTRLNNEDDSFKISDNELATLKECLPSLYSNYVICRVFLDETMFNPSFLMLAPIDETTLVDLSHTGIEYCLEQRDDGLYFVRQNRGRKLSTNN